MKKLIKIIFAGSLIASLCLVALPAEATTNLVANGGFELPVVEASQGWDIFPSGTSDLGWNVEWFGDDSSYGEAERPEPALKELHRGVNGWSPKEGNQYAELDSDWFGPNNSLNGEPASVKISQDIKTCRGGEYELKYAWSPRPNHPDNILKVYWGGEEIASHSAAGSSNTSWAEETFSNLTPTGNLTQLAFVEFGNPDSLGMFLDEVSVVQTKDCYVCPPPPPCCGDVTVNTNNNNTSVVNNVTTISRTGGNVIGGGPSPVPILQTRTRTKSGFIKTGSATAVSNVFNSVNQTQIRIRTLNLK